MRFEDLPVKPTLAEMQAAPRFVDLLIADISVIHGRIYSINHDPSGYKDTPDGKREKSDLYFKSYGYITDIITLRQGNPVLEKMIPMSVEVEKNGIRDLTRIAKNNVVISFPGDFKVNISLNNIRVDGISNSVEAFRHIGEAFEPIKLTPEAILEKTRRERGFVLHKLQYIDRGPSSYTINELKELLAELDAKIERYAFAEISALVV